MIIKKEEIKKKFEDDILNSSKIHQKFNILNYEKNKIDDMKFNIYEKIIINDIEYSIYENKENKLKYIEIKDNKKIYNIILRNNSEKSFILNKYIDKEYIKKRKSENQKFIEFYENSDFIIISDRKYQFLDFLNKDIILKK